MDREHGRGQDDVGCLVGVAYILRKLHGSCEIYDLAPSVREAPLTSLGCTEVFARIEWIVTNRNPAANRRLSRDSTFAGVAHWVSPWKAAALNSRRSGRGPNFDIARGSKLVSCTAPPRCWPPPRSLKVRSYFFSCVCLCVSSVGKVRSTCLPYLLCFTMFSISSAHDFLPSVFVEFRRLGCSKLTTKEPMSQSGFECTFSLNKSSSAGLILQIEMSFENPFCRRNKATTCESSPLSSDFRATQRTVRSRTSPRRYSRDRNHSLLRNEYL